MVYKKKFGHCNVPQRGSGANRALGVWCNQMRQSYKKIQKGQKPNNKITPENMQQLEDGGFKWNLSTSRTFDERYAELKKYKEKCRHCNVPQRGSVEYRSLCTMVQSAEDVQQEDPKRRDVRCQTNTGENSATRGCRFVSSGALF